jgi:hypothetical protein
MYSVSALFTSYSDDVTRNLVSSARLNYCPCLRRSAFKILMDSVSVTQIQTHWVALNVINEVSVARRRRWKYIVLCFILSSCIRSGTVITQWYSAGLRAGWSGIWVPAETENFSLYHRVQTSSGPTQSPIQWVPGALSLRIKRPGIKLTTHLHLVLRSRIRGTIPPFPQYTFIVWCSVEKHMDNFTLPYRTIPYHTIS